MDIKALVKEYLYLCEFEKKLFQQPLIFYEKKQSA